MSKLNKLNSFKLKHKILILIVCLILLAVSVFVFFRISYPIGYKELVEKYSESTELPTEFIYAVIRTESGFDPEAVSYADAHGLMQMTQDAFDWVKFKIEDTVTSYTDIHDPEVNIKYGTALLKILYDEFGTYEETLAAYHAGRGNVNDWLSDENYSEDGETLYDIPIPATKDYVKKVMDTKAIYETIYW